MSALAEKQRALISDFDFIVDHQERLAVAVERAKRAPALPRELKIESNRVAGCTSPVWLVAEKRHGKLTFRSDAESPVVRALVLLLCEFYNGGTSADIAATDERLFDTMGLTENLSPTRRNGLTAVQARIRKFAQEAVEVG